MGVPRLSRQLPPRGDWGAQGHGRNPLAQVPRSPTQRPAVNPAFIKQEEKKGEGIRVKREPIAVPGTREWAEQRAHKRRNNTPPPARGGPHPDADCTWIHDSGSEDERGPGNTPTPGRPGKRRRGRSTGQVLSPATRTNTPMPADVSLVCCITQRTTKQRSGAPTTRRTARKRPSKRRPASRRDNKGSLGANPPNGPQATPK